MLKMFYLITDGLAIQRIHSIPLIRYGHLILFFTILIARSVSFTSFCCADAVNVRQSMIDILFTDSVFSCLLTIFLAISNRSSCFQRNSVFQSQSDHNSSIFLSNWEDFFHDFVFTIYRVDQWFSIIITTGILNRICFGTVNL